MASTTRTYRIAGRPGRPEEDQPRGTTFCNASKTRGACELEIAQANLLSRRPYRAVSYSRSTVIIKPAGRVRRFTPDRVQLIPREGYEGVVPPRSLFLGLARHRRHSRLSFLERHEFVLQHSIPRRDGLLRAGREHLLAVQHHMKLTVVRDALRPSLNR